LNSENEIAEVPEPLKRWALESESYVPPPGTEIRVLNRLQTHLRARRQVRNVSLVVLVPVVAAAAVMLYLTVQSHRGASVQVASAHRAFHGDELLGGGELVDGPIRVDRSGTLTANLRGGTVTANGPAMLELRPDGVTLDSGTLLATGQLAVEGCGCAVTVDGRARIEALGPILQVTVVLGSVQQIRPSITCRILDLEGPVAVQPEVVAPRVAGEAEPSRPVELVAEVAREPNPVAQVRTPHPTQPSDLAQQVAAYQGALAHRGAQDGQALSEWRDMRRRWPRGSLSHEVHFQIVDALVRMGRTGEAAQEARSFLRRFPRSPRIPEMQRLAEGSGP